MYVSICFEFDMGVFCCFFSLTSFADVKKKKRGEKREKKSDEQY